MKNNQKVNVFIITLFITMAIIENVSPDQTVKLTIKQHTTDTPLRIETIKDQIEKNKNERKQREYQSILQNSQEDLIQHEEKNHTDNIPRFYHGHHINETITTRMSKNKEYEIQNMNVTIKHLKNKEDLINDKNNKNGLKTIKTIRRRNKFQNSQTMNNTQAVQLKNNKNNQTDNKNNKIAKRKKIKINNHGNGSQIINYNTNNDGSNNSQSIKVSKTKPINIIVNSKRTAKRNQTSSNKLRKVAKFKRKRFYQSRKRGNYSENVLGRYLNENKMKKTDFRGGKQTLIDNQITDNVSQLLIKPNLDLNNNIVKNDELYKIPIKNIQGKTSEQIPDTKNMYEKFRKNSVQNKRNYAKLNKTQIDSVYEEKILKPTEEMKKINRTKKRLMSKYSQKMTGDKTSNQQIEKTIQRKPIVETKNTLKAIEENSISRNKEEIPMRRTKEESTAFRRTEDIESDGINKTATKCFENIKYLDLSNQSLQYPYRNKLINYPSLIYLNLSSNKITRFNVSSLNNLKTMKYIDLNYNNITELYPQNFIQLKKLEILLLSRNNINRIRNLTFINSLNLKYLNLSYNKIKNINATHVKGLKNLIVLDVSHNQIDYINSNILNYLHSLKQLSLANNKLIEINVFNLITIQLLDVSYNFIESLNNLTIGNVSSRMKILKIDNNLINKLNENVFKNLASLIYLDISNNKLHSILPSTFQYLINLMYLNISCQNILQSSNYNKGKTYIIDFNSVEPSTGVSHTEKSLNNHQSLEVSNENLKLRNSNHFDSLLAYEFKTSTESITRSKAKTENMDSLMTSSIIINSFETNRENTNTSKDLTTIIEHMNVSTTQIVNIHNSGTNIKTVESKNTDNNINSFKPNINISKDMVNTIENINDLEVSTENIDQLLTNTEKSNSMNTRDKNTNDVKTNWTDKNNTNDFAASTIKSIYEKINISNKLETSTQNPSTFIASTEILNISETKNTNALFTSLEKIKNMKQKTELIKTNKLNTSIANNQNTSINAFITSTENKNVHLANIENTKGLESNSLTSRTLNTYGIITSRTLNTNQKSTDNTTLMLISSVNKNTTKTNKSLNYKENIKEENNTSISGEYVKDKGDLKRKRENEEQVDENFQRIKLNKILNVENKTGNVKLDIINPRELITMKEDINVNNNTTIKNYKNFEIKRNDREKNTNNSFIVKKKRRTFTRYENVNMKNERHDIVLDESVNNGNFTSDPTVKRTILKRASKNESEHNFTTYKNKNEEKISYNSDNIASETDIIDFKLNILTSISQKLKQFECVKINLKQIPKILTNSIQILNIKLNKIKTIQLGDFDDYPLIQILILSENKINLIENDSLGRLDYLKILLLNNNRLKMIPISLPESIEILNLNHNLIFKINQNDFINLDKLEKLYLANNKIRSLQSNSFVYLKNLRHLDISSNPIQIINNLYFKNLNYINLSNLKLYQTRFSSNINNNNSIITNRFPIEDGNSLIGINLLNSYHLCNLLIKDYAFRLTLKQIKYINCNNTEKQINSSEHLENYDAKNIRNNESNKQSNKNRNDKIEELKTSSDFKKMFENNEILKLDVINHNTIKNSKRNNKACYKCTNNYNSTTNPFGDINSIKKTNNFGNNNEIGTFINTIEQMSTRNKTRKMKTNKNITSQSIDFKNTSHIIKSISVPSLQSNKNNTVQIGDKKIHKKTDKGDSKLRGNNITNENHSSGYNKVINDNSQMSPITQIKTINTKKYSLLQNNVNNILVNNCTFCKVDKLYEALFVINLDDVHNLSRKIISFENNNISFVHNYTEEIEKLKQEQQNCSRKNEETSNTKLASSTNPTLILINEYFNMINMLRNVNFKNKSNFVSNNSNEFKGSRKEQPKYEGISIIKEDFVDNDNNYKERIKQIFSKTKDIRNDLYYLDDSNREMSDQAMSFESIINDRRNSTSLNLEAITNLGNVSIKQMTNEKSEQTTEENKFSIVKDNKKNVVILKLNKLLNKTHDNEGNEMTTATGAAVGKIQLDQLEVNEKSYSTKYENTQIKNNSIESHKNFTDNIKNSSEQLANINNMNIHTPLTEKMKLNLINNFYGHFNINEKVQNKTSNKTANKSKNHKMKKLVSTQNKFNRNQGAEKNEINKLVKGMNNRKQGNYSTSNKDYNITGKLVNNIETYFKNSKQIEELKNMNLELSDNYLILNEKNTLAHKPNSNKIPITIHKDLNYEMNIVDTDAEFLDIVDDKTESNDDDDVRILETSKYNELISENMTSSHQYHTGILIFLFIIVFMFAISFLTLTIQWNSLFYYYCSHYRHTTHDEQDQLESDNQLDRIEMLDSAEVYSIT